MYASGVILGAGLLPVRDDMNCRHDKVPDNATLHPTALTSNTLLSAEQCYSSIECEALRVLHGLEKFHNCCFYGSIHHQ